jgi:hypothetical protein
MESIFISSLARGEMATIRVAGRAAVESLQMRPVMFETAPASREDSRRALLDELARCDALLLLLGAEYGERTEHGVSATEDEFNEAVRLGIPVIALVQDIERSAEQQGFVERVRGSWAEGRFAPSFNNGTDVGFQAVAALNAWRQRAAGDDRDVAARERALALAQGTGRAGQSHTGAKARVVLVPCLGRQLIDAVMAADPVLAEDLGMCARTSGLVTNEMALRQQLTAVGLAFESATVGGYEQLQFLVARDGAILAEGAVSGAGLLGSSVVQASSLRRVVSQSGAFAHGVWQRIDVRDDIRTLAVTVAIPDASMKVYSDEDFAGSSLSIGSMSSPPVVLAPDPPRIVRREDVGSTTLLEHLVAEVRQAFALQGRAP